MLPLVAELVVSRVGGDAALVVLVGADGAYVAASAGCSSNCSEWRFDPDELGPDLEQGVLDKCRLDDRSYKIARSAVLVSDAALFGAIIVLFKAEAGWSENASEVLGGLADIAAAALSSAAQFERMEKINAELSATRAVLERTEKLRALGEMAAGVSHDLKNILNPLGLYLQLAKRQLEANQKDQVATSLEQMGGVVQRGTELLERLRQFSRQSPSTGEESCDLNKLTQEALAIARPRMATHAAKAVRPPRVRDELGSPPQVLARSGEIVSAIVNLLANAQDVLMTTGGNIVARTGLLRGGAFVEVCDDGPGIPPEVKARIFEPFFTTKGDAGTGLGLAMVYATMVRHSGTVEVESEPGKGTTFRLWFPARPTPPS